MTSNPSVIVVALSLVSGPALAQDLSCPAALTWRDATYARRIIDTGIDGRTITVELEGSPTLWRAQFDAGEGRVAIISMENKTADGTIALTFGKNRPRPSDFADIAKAVEPPMVAGNWRGMERPCAVKNGSAIAFDEKNVPNTKALAAKPVAVRGVLRRDGLRFTYSATLSDKATSPGLSWQGELIFSASARLAQQTGDVQGWHVYRADTFVRTIPLGKPVALATVLAELDAAPQAGPETQKR